MALDLASTNQHQGPSNGGISSQTAAAQRIAPFTGLLEAASEVQLLLDSEGRIVHVGGSPEYVMGYGRTTLEQQPVLAAITPEQRGGFSHAFQQVRSGIAQPPFAMYWPNPWGGRFDAGVQLSPLVEDGKLLGVMMKAFELSSRYAFEAFLVNDAPTSLAHAKKSPMAMFFLDARGQCTFVNDRWAEVTGQSVKEALGFGFLSTVNPADRDRFKQVAGQGHQRKEGWRLLFEVALPNGATRRVDAAAAPLLAPDGNVVAYIGALTPFSAALAAQATGTPQPQPAPIQQVPAHHPAQASAQPEAPVQQAPAQPAPAQQAPVPPQIPTQQAPLQQSPLQQSPAQLEASVQQAPVQPAPVQPQKSAQQVAFQPQVPVQQPQQDLNQTPEQASPQQAPRDQYQPQQAPLQQAQPAPAPAPLMPANPFQMTDFGAATGAGQTAQAPATAPTPQQDPVAPQSAQLPFALPTEMVANPVIENRPSSWDPPAIKDGFTDPNLLLGLKKASVEAEAEIPPSEPGLDKVTGLANRLLFAQHVASTVTRMQSDALTVSVSFVHLHGLDAIRQSIGSRATNDYLFLLAKRLEATIRSIEIAGRIEGDIVGVLSINWLFADDLPVVAQRLLGKLCEPLAGKDGQPMVVDMSLGMAVARPGEHVNELFTRAWNALQLSRQNTETHFEIDFGA